MKYIFVTANERLDSGLIKSQLISPVTEFLGKNSIFVNIHRPFGNSFRSKTFKTINIPILVPFRFINFTRLFFLNELLCFFYMCFLVLLVAFKKIEFTFVARGYVPGLVCWFAQCLFGQRYIFDPRSLYIHEHLGAGNLEGSQICFKYWKWVEKRIVFRAEKTVCVSKGMSDYYKALSPERLLKTSIIPCFCEQANRPDSACVSKIKESLGYNSQDLVIAYYGSLNTGWNNLEMYLEFFDKIKNYPFKMLIISQDAESLKRSALKNYENITVVNGDTFTDKGAASLLDVADYGLVILKKSPDWKTRLSVKFAEYTSRGLPVIIGEYVGEAVRLKNKHGLVPSTIIDKEFNVCDIRKSTSDERQKIKSWAKIYFNKKNILHIKDFGK
jgi:hypothetical protein